MPIDVRPVYDVVCPLAEAMAELIEDAVKANPKLRSNAIRMTALDVVVASVVTAVAKTSVGMTLGEIIEMHQEHVIDIVAAQQAVEDSHG